MGPKPLWIHISVLEYFLQFNDKFSGFSAFVRLGPKQMSHKTEDSIDQGDFPRQVPYALY